MKFIKCLHRKWQYLLKYTTAKGFTRHKVKCRREICSETGTFSSASMAGLRLRKGRK